jgi:ABC-type multidrug transport system fused ATPase/permease subunit
MDRRETGDPMPVIRGLSFNVKAGEVVALVGSSGAGKSTIADLLARFYDPQDGRILVDGRDVREFRYASYLAGIAMVTQEPFLFNTTIRENIRYGRDSATEAEIAAAARAAYAHDFILEQPEGYDTVIGDRGVKLSGGQRQRITIARAILKDASILILDEATSSLDTGSEKEVQRAIENLIRTRTTFVIAHRLSTIASADKILVIEDGRIVERGRHEELLLAKGRYFMMWRSQNPDAGSSVA